MGKFIIFKEDDDSAIGFICQEEAPGVLPGTYAVASEDHELFDEVSLFISDRKKFNEKVLKYDKEKADFKFTDRPEVGCSANKKTILADGTDEFIISGIPKGSVVRLAPGVEWKVDDGVFHFTAIVPSDYEFTVISPFFKEKVIKMTAVKDVKK